MAHAEGVKLIFYNKLQDSLSSMTYASTFKGIRSTWSTGGARAVGKRHLTATLFDQSHKQ